MEVGSIEEGGESDVIVEEEEEAEAEDNVVEL